MTESLDAYTTARYRSLGLIANPFALRSPRGDESAYVSLEIHKEANKLLVALDVAAREGKTRPLWVDRSVNVHDFYNTAAENVAEQALIRDDDFNMLPLYLQLFMARAGRIRSALHVLAERVATRRFDLTLAAWVRRVAEDEPDEGLPAWQAVGDAAWQAFLHELEADPAAAIAAHFGELVDEREAVIRPPHDVREASLETEPEETDETAEEDALTAQTPDLSEAILAPKPEGEEEPGPEAPREMDAIAAYVIEYTKTRLSPVIARGLRAYVERGYGQMAQELKITKAPRKTLKKLIEFAAHRFRKVVMLYDGLDGWMSVPEDLRHKLVATFTELRLLMGQDGIMVFLVPTGAAPELEDQFGGRDVVSWTFEGLLREREDEDEIDASTIDGWIAAATLPPRAPMTLADPPLARLAKAADGSLERFVTLAARALDVAADRGATALEMADAEAALQAAAD